MQKLIVQYTPRLTLLPLAFSFELFTYFLFKYLNRCWLRLLIVRTQVIPTQPTSIYQVCVCAILPKLIWQVIQIL